jgi:predicted RNA-binding Zn-ribbon protein involved in translation (DUF1610 family)
MPKSSKKKSKEIFVRICPRCGSKDVTMEFTRQTWLNFFVCQSCGFRSVIFPEVSREEAKKLPKRKVNYYPWLVPTENPEIKGFPYAWLIVTILFIIVIIILSIK